VLGGYPVAADRPRCISRLGPQSLTCARMTGQYDLASRDDLIRLLEQCDPLQRYGSVWESAPNQERLEPPKAIRILTRRTIEDHEGHGEWVECAAPAIIDLRGPRTSSVLSPFLWTGQPLRRAGRSPCPGLFDLDAPTTGLGRNRAGAALRSRNLLSDQRVLIAPGLCQLVEDRAT
jgi:hypothetical protein